MTDNLKLLPINEKDYEFLYELLSERKQITFISHKKMPTYEEHVKFIESEPYSKWYIIQIDDKKIGSIYLTKENEIGIHFFTQYEESERFQNVIKEFFLKEPQDRFVMNVSPKNEQYIDLAKKLGFHLVQHTYERDESKIF
tara:strand:- start:64 stop:486 length:423 start_codon:yes stop_codon:yes gene_type:complete